MYFDMVQPLSAGDYIKVKIVNCIFGNQVRKQIFQTFHVYYFGIFARSRN